MVALVVAGLVLLVTGVSVVAWLSARREPAPATQAAPAVAGGNRPSEDSSRTQARPAGTPGDLERRLAALTEAIEKLAVARGDERMAALREVEAGSSDIPHLPAEMKEKLAGILDKRRGELLGVEGAYPYMMRIYSVLDGAKARSLQAEWEANRVEYADPKSGEAHALTRDLVRGEQADKIKRLLDRGFDPLEEKVPYGVSLFTLIGEGNRPKLLELLLSRGIPADSVSKNRGTALEYQTGQGGSSLEMIRLLLVHGANPNQQNARGRTPLHHGAARGREDIVSLLLEHKADPNLPDKDGATPLDLAEKGTSPAAKKIVEMLTKAGAKRGSALRQK
jgi:hypothetical protein